MKVVMLGGVEIDECPSCAVKWFDGGELDQLVRARRATSLHTLGPQSLALKSAERCAVCGDRTSKFHFHTAPQVHVDVCSVHGQWLDAWDVRHLVGWGRKEAALTVQVSAGDYHRRTERALWAGFAFLDGMFGLRVGLGAAMWLSGARIDPTAVLVGVALVMGWCFSCTEGLRHRFARRV